MTDNMGEFYDPSEYAEAHINTLLGLVERLEHYAQSYSEDYRDGLDDSSAASVGSADLGNTLETDMSFHVERYREEYYSSVLPIAVQGKPILSKYTIGSCFKRRHLRLQDIPQNIQDFLLEMSDYTPADLENESVEFAYGLSQRFSLTTDGEFEHDYGLSLYIDDDEVELPDEVLESLQEEAMPVSDDVLVGYGEEFLDIFSQEEILALRGIASQVIREYDEEILRKFCDQLSNMRNLSRLERYAIVDNLMAQLFLPDTIID